MKFYIYFFQKTALYYAIEKENLEVIQLLLEYGKININLKNIFNYNLIHRIQMHFLLIQF